MKASKYDQFKIWCSEIHALFSIPKGITMPRKSEMKKYEAIMNSDKEKTEEQIEFLKKHDAKIALYNNPPISKSTINSLIRQYGWKFYKKKTASSMYNFVPSFISKGCDLENEAVELLSKIDGENYKLCTDIVENDYILGRADIVAPNKVIDIKISWNVNSFLKSRISRLDDKYWYQMQGYMELYDIDEAEVVFLLLNTPIELIEREKVKLLNKFMVGEIDRDKYELEMGNVESAFTYSNIPLKKRYFRYKISRERGIFDKIYQRVDKSREWLVEFDKSMRKNNFIVPSELYINDKEDDTELDTSKPG